MTRTTRLAVLLAALLLASLLPGVVVAQTDAPGDAGPAILPVLASTELAQGPTRFLFSLTDQEGRLVAAPDVDVRLRFYDHAADPETVAFESDAEFLWAVEGVSGLYKSDVAFPHAGRWGTRFDATFPDGRTETVRADYDVRERTTTPSIGAPGPAVDTPTAADVEGDLSAISTDPEPVPRFYELSIAEALAADAPALIAFATPAFCQSATCGPTLEKVKAVAAAHPEVNVVHVEPYAMHVVEGRLQPLLTDAGGLQAAPWTLAWGLLTEPYVVVVAADGTVRAKFEGVVTVEELEEAISSL